MSGIVIIGAGQAGGRAALALRAGGYKGPITLVGEESYLPYERPPLSKGVLTGGRMVEDGQLADATKYADEGIDLILGQQVQAILPESRVVTLADGNSLACEKLVLATGSRPRGLALPGTDLDGIHVLRTAEDALAIRDRLKPGRSVAIIGGGFIGLEVAASARKLGCNVTLLEAQERILQRSLPDEAALAVANLHKENGVNINTGVSLKAFLGDDRVVAVQLADSREIPADVVVIGIGIVPETTLASDAGLAVENGVRVNANCQTSAPDIYAIGDCACCDSARYNKAIRLESYQNADMQAATAAAHILGAPAPYNPVPWLWSEQFDHTLQTAGFPAEADMVISRDMGDGKPTLFFSLKEQRLTGVTGIGPGASVAQDVRVSQMLMEKEITPTVEDLSDTAVSLKKLLKGG